MGPVNIEAMMDKLLAKHSESSRKALEENNVVLLKQQEVMIADLSKAFDTKFETSMSSLRAEFSSQIKEIYATIGKGLTPMDVGVESDSSGIVTPVEKKSRANSTAPASSARRQLGASARAGSLPSRRATQPKGNTKENMVEKHEMFVGGLKRPVPIPIKKHIMEQVKDHFPLEVQED